MRDRWLNIYHIYHLSITHQVQVECPKSVLLFEHSLPTAVAMSAQAVEPSASLPLTTCKRATWWGLSGPEDIFTSTLEAVTPGVTSNTG